jgi:hypothetical protein
MTTPAPTQDATKQAELDWQKRAAILVVCLLAFLAGAYLVFTGAAGSYILVLIGAALWLGATVAMHYYFNACKLSLASGYTAV